MNNSTAHKVFTNQYSRLLRGLVGITDLLILNIYSLMFVIYVWFTFDYLIVYHYRIFWLAINLTYLLVSIISPPVMVYSQINNTQVVMRSIRTAFLYTLISIIILLMIDRRIRVFWNFYFFYYLFYFLILTGERLLGRWLLKKYRHQTANTRHVVFAGMSPDLIEICEEFRNDPSYRYEVMGYYADTPYEGSDKDDRIAYLGKLSEMIPDINKCDVKPDMLLCSLPPIDEFVGQVIDYCDDHVVMFLSVPNLRNSTKRKMHIVYYGDVPVLSLREMPLAALSNRFSKRLFDICFSSLFLLLVFWWLAIIVAVIIKLTMPGPVFFKQKRHGLDGKEFWCYKFRSMKVNDDSDRVQATKDDPRKTRFGEFMRHYNIDELPQFWNVLVGNMSVVGPRPHMLLHTEEYSKLVPKYMVRHFCKPGITGWAQVTGSRGETKEVWQMEERVKKDIWYIEHWSMSLDMKIIWMTIKNSLTGKDQQAY